MGPRGMRLQVQRVLGVLRSSGGRLHVLYGAGKCVGHYGQNFESNGRAIFFASEPDLK